MKKLSWGEFPYCWSGIVLGLLLLTLVSAFVLSLAQGNWSSAFLSGTAVLLSLAPYVAGRTLDVHFPNSFSFAVAVFVFATLFLGEVGNFYETYWWWDLILHAGTGIAFGLIGLTVLLIFFKKKRVSADPLILALFAFSFSVAIGALWEIFEFSLDQLFGLNTQRSGLPDTMGDLIIDSLAAAAAAVTAYWYVHPRKKAPLEEVIREAVNENV
jgi:hypothetical protein